MSSRHFYVLRKSYRRYTVYFAALYSYHEQRCGKCEDLWMHVTSSHKRYKQGTVSISNFLKPSLQELLGPSLSRILIAVVWIMKTFFIDEDEPLRIIS